MKRVTVTAYTERGNFTAPPQDITTEEAALLVLFVQTIKNLNYLSMDLSNGGVIVIPHDLLQTSVIMVEVLAAEEPQP